MSTVEYACVFVRVGENRLVAAERLVLALPQLFGDALVACDLAFDRAQRFLGLRVHLRPAPPSPARRDRLAFWTARAGGRATEVAALDQPDQEALHAHFGDCEHRVGGVAPGDLAAVSARFFTEAGAPPARKRVASCRPRLVMDVGGPGWEGTRWNAEQQVLFVAGPIAPPAGDAVPLVFRIPGLAEPLGAMGTVVEVTAPAAAAPGRAAGFALRIDDAPFALAEALAAHTASTEHEHRAAPRFPVNAPVKVTAPASVAAPARAPPPAPVSAPAPAPAKALIEYATDQELAADFVENLSQGGAFVRTAHPPPPGTAVRLELKLPNGAELAAAAEVAFVNAHGMGVRFQLDAEAEQVLAAAIAHISARPRRALVVDDDGLVRRMLADALGARGFEVLTAADATEGLRTLAAELLALDLLLTDVRMPGMSGEDLVQTIRRTGGEADLAIVAVTGHLEPGMEKSLEVSGVDAVLDKALGAELVAQAADAVLERKRMRRQDG